MVTMFRTMRTTQRFAIDWNESRLTIVFACKRRDPIHKCLLEFQRPNQRQDTADRVMSRNTILERDKLATPRQLCSSELSDIAGAVTSGNRPGNTNEENVDQLVFFATINSRIVNVRKMGREIAWQR
jgi:hypothetical protein